MKISIKKILILIFLAIIILLSGCSNNDLPKTTAVIIQGKVEIEGIELTETYYKENTANNDSSLNITQANIDTDQFEFAECNMDEYIFKFSRPLAKDYLKKDILQNKGKLLKKITDDTYLIKTTALENLQKNPLVTYVEPNYLVSIQQINLPNDPGYTKQWNLEMLGLPTTWNDYQGDNHIIVAVLDSGILPNHPDLQSHIVAGYDYVDDDSDPTDTDPDFSHGTHVAGIIGAVANNHQGIAGINWQVKIMPIRVIGADGHGDYSALIAGIRGAVDRGANVINLSLTGPADSPLLYDAVKYAIENGVAIVAASGNDSTTPILYPAHYPEVISVGAIGPTKKKAYYSNYGPNLDLVAPGGDITILQTDYNCILSTAGHMEDTGPVHQYSWAQGTSMAAPHVSGIVALLYSAGITDPLDIEERLKETADDLGPVGRDDEYGAGLVNINRLLDLKEDTTTDIDPLLLFSNVKITAAKKSNYNLIAETIVNTDSSGNFSLKITPGSWTINGWIDCDGNEKINPGDYYGIEENILVEDYNPDLYVVLKLQLVR